MNIHKNARLTPLGREHLVRAVQGGRTAQAAAQAAPLCRRRLPGDGAQMDRPLSRVGRGQSGRPFVAAALQLLAARS
ncbi:transposase [Chelatococcus asaccharovorans]|nr:transposase [Chelatococcus asaccharovorans]CAH1686249.1 transposase [Chelatococcus asaccharovorans]